MNPVCILLLAALAPDAGVSRDAGPPSWVPKSKHIDLEKEAIYGLRRAGDGYVYDSPRFEARVARDGVVYFKDKHGFVSFPFFPFMEEGSRPQGPTLESMLRDHFTKHRRAEPEPPAEPAPDPRRMVQSEVCPPSSSCYVVPTTNAIEVRGSFDLTDEIMRAYGQHPYGREKARFLSATFEFRIRMAMAARQADMKTALAHLPEYLDALWGDERYSPRERRRILYEIWYETDQTPEGERAARSIDEFIRRRLPCGSPVGYTGEELESFQRLHPDRRFSAAGDCDRASGGWAPK